MEVLTPLLLGVLAVLGLVVGARMQRWAARAPYRRPTDLPRRRGTPRWVMPACVLLPLVLLPSQTAQGHLDLALVVVPFSWLLVALAVVDLDVHRLPDRLQLPAYPALALALSGLALVQRDAAPLTRSVLATVVVLVVGLVLWAVAPRQGLGLGDVKLAGLLAGVLAQLGWSQVLLGLWLGLLLGGMTAALLVVRGRARRQDHLALGPALAAGALLALAVG